jgi:Mg/Co/Ni transporter MgtE
VADAAAKCLTPAQTVDVLDRLPATQRAVLYRLLPKQQAAAVFEVFSNPFITTFVDATGLVIYFLIAKAVLHI